MKYTKKQAGALGGFAAVRSLGEEGVKRRALKGGEATFAKYGREHYVKAAWASHEARRKSKGQ